MAISYMTKEGYKKKMEEIAFLESVERPRISAAIAEARDKGDLSENSEYDAAKEAQGMLEMKIAKLKDLVVKIPAKAGAGGRLFGAVTSKEVSDALKAQHNVTIAKAKIVQDEPIKSFGAYQLKCKLGYEIVGTVHVEVVEG